MKRLDPVAMDPENHVITLDDEKSREAIDVIAKQVSNAVASVLLKKEVPKEGGFATESVVSAGEVKGVKRCAEDVQSAKAPKRAQLIAVRRP